MSHDFHKAQFTTGHTSCYGHSGGKGDCASHVKEDASSFAEFLGADKRPKHPHREHVRNHDESRGSHRGCENKEHRPSHECGPPSIINKYVLNTVICRGSDSSHSGHCAEEPHGKDKAKQDHGSVGCYDDSDKSANAKHTKRPEHEHCEDMKGPKHRQNDDAPDSRRPPNRGPMMLAGGNTEPALRPPPFTHMPVLIGETPSGSTTTGVTSTNPVSTGSTSSTTSTGVNGVFASSSESAAEVTAAFELAAAEVSLTTIDKIAKDTENAVESMKQQTIGKHLSNMVKNSNLTSY